MWGLPMAPPPDSSSTRSHGTGSPISPSRLDHPAGAPLPTLPECAQRALELFLLVVDEVSEQVYLGVLHIGAELHADDDLELREAAGGP